MIIVNKRNRKSMSMVVRGDDIIISCPLFTAQKEIDNFIDINSNWINKQLLYQRQQRIELNKNFSDNQIMMFGESTSIIYNSKNNMFDFKNHKLYLKKTNLTSFIKEYYLAYLNRAVEEISTILNVKYKTIKLINAKTRWGSCKQDKTLSFNWRLIFLPIDIQCYVIIHELCHIIEMNHSQKFWNIVSYNCKNYKELKKDLKSFSYILSLFR